MSLALVVASTAHAATRPARTQFCGLARTVNGFDYVDARGLDCPSALADTVRIERGARGPWGCSRSMHGPVELACRNGSRLLALLERSPVPARRRGAIVTLANWSFRLHGPDVEGREALGGWRPFGRSPWCVPDVPREALIALRLRPVTPHGGCFVR